jgi:two-component system, cell cycle sensor histidine kinase PleC
MNGSASSPPSQTVAIIDDRPTNLKILAALAQTLGPQIKVETFERPLDAIAAAADSPPDLIITDYRMPEIDGTELVRRCRAVPSCADVPIIIITAYEDRELRCRALDAGATDFLPSPVDHREFRARAHNLLLLRRQQLQLAERASLLEAQMRDEERRHRDALRESHELLLRVIDAVPMAVAATDREGRYVFVNDWFSRRWGRPASSLIGLTPVAARDDLAARVAMERDRRIVAGLEEPSVFEETIADPAGGRRVLLTSKALLRDHGDRPSLVVTASLDITDRKDGELALLAAKEEAELASRSKTEFLANMSHELRTPLNAIIGFSQVIADEMMGPLANARYASYGRDICASAQHLLGIIGDILDVSKLEAGKTTLDEQPSDVRRLVQDVLRLVAERSAELEVGIDLDIPADLPPLLADRLKLKQVLLNLLTNAIKFSRAGGRVLLRARFGDEGFTLAVIDHGIGMDEREVKTAVSRFGQVASPWNRRHPGTGLGLPLAIGLVELHGGRVGIESRKGIGTTVSVHLPRSRALLKSAAASA